MKKNIISVACALSLMAGASAYADNVQEKSCTVLNGDSVCTIKLDQGKDTVKVTFQDFPVKEEEQKIVCKFENNHVNMEGISGYSGDVINGKVDKNDHGVLTAILQPNLVKINGELAIDVESSWLPEEHTVKIYECLGTP